MPSQEAVRTMWTLSLVIYFVVVAVVAVLLTMILFAAKRIRAGTAAIWTVGQKIANNTIHIPMLVRTNRMAERILASAGRTAAEVAAIEQHAAICPHCPTCVLGGRGGVR